MINVIGAKRKEVGNYCVTSSVLVCGGGDGRGGCYPTLALTSVTHD